MQHPYTHDHPGFTGSMQAAKAAYRLHIISASCAQRSDQYASAIVSRGQTAFFLLYSDGKKYKRKKRSGHARLLVPYIGVY